VAGSNLESGTVRQGEFSEHLKRQPIAAIPLQAQPSSGSAPFRQDHFRVERHLGLPLGMTVPGPFGINIPNPV